MAKTKVLQIVDNIVKNAETLDGRHADEFALASDAVLHKEQTLTKEQQAQARANIGAVEKGYTIRVNRTVVLFESGDAIYECAMVDGYVFDWDKLVECVRKGLPVKCHVYDTENDYVSFCPLTFAYIEDGYAVFCNSDEGGIINEIHINVNGDIFYRTFDTNSNHVVCIDLLCDQSTQEQYCVFSNDYNFNWNALITQINNNTNVICKLHDVATNIDYIIPNIRIVINNIAEYVLFHSIDSRSLIYISVNSSGVIEYEYVALMTEKEGSDIATRIQKLENTADISSVSEEEMLNFLMDTNIVQPLSDINNFIYTDNNNKLYVL